MSLQLFGQWVFLSGSDYITDIYARSGSRIFLIWSRSKSNSRIEINVIYEDSFVRDKISLIRSVAKGTATSQRRVISYFNIMENIFLWYSANKISWGSKIEKVRENAYGTLCYLWSTVLTLIQFNNCFWSKRVTAIKAKLSGPKEIKHI